MEAVSSVSGMGMLDLKMQGPESIDSSSVASVVCMIVEFTV